MFELKLIICLVLVLSAISEAASTYPTIYGSWSDWSACSKSCGVGVSTRLRKCLILRKCNTKDLEESKSCTIEDCQIYEESVETYAPVAVTTVVARTYPTTYGSWSKWSECSKTCGIGVSTRTRKCLIVKKCNTELLENSKACNNEDCPLLTTYESYQENYDESAETYAPVAVPTEKKDDYEESSDYVSTLSGLLYVYKITTYTSEDQPPLLPGEVTLTINPEPNEDGATVSFILTNQDVSKFGKGEMDVFYYNSEIDLGKIGSIKLEYNSFFKAKSALWKMRKIIISNTINYYTVTFTFDGSVGSSLNDKSVLLKLTPDLITSPQYGKFSQSLPPEKYAIPVDYENKKDYLEYEDAQVPDYVPTQPGPHDDYESIIPLYDDDEYEDIQIVYEPSTAANEYIVSTENFVYKISITTSTLSPSISPGDVFLTFNPDSATASIPPIQLSNADGRHFRSGATDLFNRELQMDVGIIKSIKLSYESRGYKQQEQFWRVTQVIISNERTGYSATFNGKDRQVGSEKSEKYIIIFPDQSEVTATKYLVAKTFDYKVITVTSDYASQSEGGELYIIINPGTMLASQKIRLTNEKINNFMPGVKSEFNFKSEIDFKNFEKIELDFSSSSIITNPSWQPSEVTVVNVGAGISTLFRFNGIVGPARLNKSVILYPTLDGQWCKWPQTFSRPPISCVQPNQEQPVLSRERKCNCPAPINFGLPCKGDGKEFKQALLPPCMPSSKKPMLLYRPGNG